MSAALAVVFGFILSEAGQWSYRSALFPLLVGSAGLAAVALLWLSRVASRGRATVFRSPSRAGAQAGAAMDREWAVAGRFFLWLLGVFAAAYLLGQLTALPLFVLLYLRLASGESWRFSAIAAAVVWCGLYGVFELALSIAWLDGVLWPWLGLV